MAEKKVKIGIEMYYPYDLIIEAIMEFIATGDINKEELFVKMHTVFEGVNRARKATNSLYAVVTNKTHLQKAIKANFSADSFSKLSRSDQELICLSMICLKYPFVMDAMFHFAKLFNLQDTVNVQYITSTMASTYGSNRTMEIALKAVYFFTLNANIIKREKPGLFSKCTPAQTTSFAKEAWISTFFEFNGKKSLPINDLQYEPLMTYLLDLEIDWKNTKILETMEDYTNQIIINKLK